MKNLKINFEEIKKQNINKETIVNLLEALYMEIQNNDFNRIKLNEICIAESINIDEYQIELKNKPISINEIFIVNKNGQIFITPNSITEISNNKVKFTDNRIKNKEELFVTYKY